MNIRASAQRCRRLSARHPSINIGLSLARSPVQKTNEQKIVRRRRHSDDESAPSSIAALHFCSTPIHIQIAPRGERYHSIPSLLLCLLPSCLPFGEQFHFSGLNGSETSSAKIPPARTSFPPSLLSLHSSFERREKASNGNLLIPNGIVSLQASALHGPTADRQTWPWRGEGESTQCICCHKRSNQGCME